MVTLPDGELLLAAADSDGQARLYRYDSQRHDDAGAAIISTWQTPWLAARSGRRWANHAVHVQGEDGPVTTLNVARYRDHDWANPRMTEVAANRPADLWDTCRWDEAFWDNGQPMPARLRDHFVAEAMAFRVRHDRLEGPVTLFGLAMQGRYES